LLDPIIKQVFLYFRETSTEQKPRFQKLLTTLDSPSGQYLEKGIHMPIHTIHPVIFTCGLIHLSRRDNSLRLEHRHPSRIDQNFLLIILQKAIFNTSSIYQHIRTTDVAPASTANKSPTNSTRICGNSTSTSWHKNFTLFQSYLPNLKI
jgi:hypothetical protein